MNITTPKTQRQMIAMFAIGFVIWSIIFIYQTTFIAIDGKRYFCLFDDAMISMRYAWNFTHGTGLVWNAGEYVEGYTNLLMTLLMSVAILVFGKLMSILAIQILGIIFMLAIAYASLKIADHITREQDGNPSQKAWIGVLAFILALTYYPLAYWSLTGMETGLLALLLSIAILCTFNYTANRKFKDLFFTALCLGLAFLTRNDSFIFVIPISIFIAWEVFRKKRNRKVLYDGLSALIIYGLFVAGQLLFQYAYYGEMLPNTYILKLTGMSLPLRIENGLGFILPFLIQISFLLIPAILTMYYRFQKEKLLLLVLVFSAIGYQIYVGGDPWNYWRMLSPTIPLLNILFINAVSDGTHAKLPIFKSRFLHIQNPVLQMCLLAAMGVLVANAYFISEALFLDRPFYVSANQRNVNIAVALSEVTKKDASVGVFWAGAIPYFAERKGVDFLGKSDRYIAHLPPDLSGKISVNGMISPPGHNKYDLNYSIKLLQPTYVEDFKWGTQDLSEWGKSHYIKVEYKGIRLFLLKDSPLVLWNKINIPAGTGN